MGDPTWLYVAWLFRMPFQRLPMAQIVKWLTIALSKARNVFSTGNIKRKSQYRFPEEYPVSGLTNTSIWGRLYRSYGFEALGKQISLRSYRKETWWFHSSCWHHLDFGAARVLPTLCRSRLPFSAIISCHLQVFRGQRSVTICWFECRCSSASAFFMIWNSYSSL